MQQAAEDRLLAAGGGESFLPEVFRMRTLESPCPRFPIMIASGESERYFSSSYARAVSDLGTVWGENLSGDTRLGGVS